MKKLLILLLVIGCSSPESSQNFPQVTQSKQTSPQTTQLSQNSPQVTQSKQTSPQTTQISNNCKNLNKKNQIYMSDPNRGTLDFNESFDVHFDNLYDEKNSEVGILASGNIGPDEFDIKINYPVDEKIFVKYCGQDIELTVGNMKITGSLGTRDVSVLVDQGLDLENNVYFSMEGYVGDDSFRVDNRVIRWGAGVYRGNGSKNSLVVILSILIWTTAFYEF